MRISFLSIALGTLVIQIQSCLSCALKDWSLKAVVLSLSVSSLKAENTYLRPLARPQEEQVTTSSSDAAPRDLFLRDTTYVLCGKSRGLNQYRTAFTASRLVRFFLRRFRHFKVGYCSDFCDKLCNHKPCYDDYRLAELDLVCVCVDDGPYRCLGNSECLDDVCQDADECTSPELNDCAENAVCQNTVGNYTCSCPPGFEGDGYAACDNLDECQGEGEGNNCDVNAECTDIPGNFTCACNPGWGGDGVTCNNLDECQGEGDGNNCNVNAECTDTPGSFACTCNPGWGGDGLTCTNFDECQDEGDGNNCDVNAECRDTPGNFTCSCDSGWQGDGVTCEDIDECEDPVAACGTGAICANTLGSYNCTCPDSCYEPTYAMGTDDGCAPVECFVSCAEARAAGNTESGLIILCPSYLQQCFTVYCDHETDDGNWALFFAYKHIGNENVPLVEGTLPTDPLTGYSHVNIQDFGYVVDDISKIRFYCETSNHNRTIHFTSTNDIVKQIAYTGDQTRNTAAEWKGAETTVLSDGQDAVLPVATTTVSTSTTGGLHEFPFYKAAANHWAVQGLGKRWECDDYPNNDDHTTLHQVWVKIEADTCYESCSTALNAGIVDSGVIKVCPGGDRTKISSVYCDQETVGGGWALFFAYKHIGGENNVLVEGALPTDPDNGYSHIDIQDLGYEWENITEMRFYCETALHNRTIHFVSADDTVKQIAFTGDQTGNTAAAWTGAGTTVLPGGEDAFLPNATDLVFTNTTGGLHDFPFYNDGDYHWSIRGLGSRWECDDYTANSDYTTLHQVWVKIGGEPVPECFPPALGTQVTFSLLNVTDGVPQATIDTSAQECVFLTVSDISPGGVTHVVATPDDAKDIGLCLGALVGSGDCSGSEMGSFTFDQDIRLVSYQMGDSPILASKFNFVTFESAGQQSLETGFTKELETPFQKPLEVAFGEVLTWSTTTIAFGNLHLLSLTVELI